MATRKYLRTEFQSIGPCVQNDGTVASGTGGETNLTVIDGVPWEYFVIGTQTITVPSFSTGASPGLDISHDKTNTDGVIYTPFTNSKASRLAFTIGTDPAFYVSLKLSCGDLTGANPLCVGFHGGAAATNPLQVHTATFADYTDKACIGFTGGTADIQTITCLNNAVGDTTTDTTLNGADNTDVTLTVKVSAAGAVTYEVDGAAATSAAFTFDSGDIVVPFIYVLHGAGVMNDVILRKFVCGHQ